MAALFNLRSDNFGTGFPLSPPQNPHLLIVFLEANANISGSNHLFFPFLLSDALFSGNFRFFSCCFVSDKTHLALKDYPQVSWRKALDLPKLLRNENNLFSSFILLHRFFSSLFSANFFHNQNWNQKSLQNLASSSGSELSRKSWKTTVKDTYKKNKTISRTLNKKHVVFQETSLKLLWKAFVWKVSFACAIMVVCPTIAKSCSSSESEPRIRKPEPNGSNNPQKRNVKHHRCQAIPGLSIYKVCPSLCLPFWWTDSQSANPHCWPSGWIFEQLPNQLDTLSASEDSSIHKLVASFSCLSSTILALHIFLHGLRWFVEVTRQHLHVRSL